MERYFKFNPKDYDEDGINIKDGELFSDLIHRWEREFNDQFLPFFANYLFASVSSILLLKKCFIVETDEDFGSELINGKVDLETNLKIQQYSNRVTVYAIGSEIDEEEPLYLIIDDRTVDGILCLKHIPESGEDDFRQYLPVGIEKN